MKVLEPQPKIESEPPMSDRPPVNANLGSVATGRREVFNGNSFPPDVVETVRGSKSADIAVEICDIVQEFGTTRDDGTHVMTYEELCARIIIKRDIPKNEIAGGLFAAEILGIVTLTSDHLLVVSPESA